MISFFKMLEFEEEERSSIVVKEIRRFNMIASLFKIEKAMEYLNHLQPLKHQREKSNINKKARNQ